MPVRRRRAPMRRKPAVRRFVKPSRSGPNTAKVVEFFDLGVFEANVAHDFGVAGIAPGGRSALVAPAYGLYRIAQVEYKITPRFDTYTPNLAAIGDAPVEVPKMYWKINRYGDAPVGFGPAGMLSLGSKPVRLDDKTLTIKYKPNILLANAGAAAAAQAGGSGQVKITPWLSTDNQTDNNAFALSTTQHYGHLMFIECAAAGDGTPAICEIQCRVIYEFKNPRLIDSERAQQQTYKHVSHNLSVATLKADPVRTDGWNLQQS